MKSSKHLALILALSLLTSCSGGTSSMETSSAADSDEVTDITSAVTEETDNLPEVDYGGKTFTLLIRTGQRYEFDAESENGDTVNDAVYNRNRAVEERLNIKLELISVPCAWGDEATAFNNRVRQDGLAGDNSYQVIAGYTPIISALIGENLFQDWSTVPYIDLNREWWAKGINDTMTINDHIYMITGDSALTTWSYTYCFFVNQTMEDMVCDESLYDVVNEGRWTYDVLLSLTKDTYSDLNGNTKADEDDRFAIVTNLDQDIYAYQTAFEVPMYTVGDDGFPKLNIASDRAQTALEKLNAMYWNEPGAFVCKGATEQELISMFGGGNLLFLAASLDNSNALRESNTDYGILPYPKLDETQKEYHNTLSDGYTSFLLPNGSDAETAGMVMEAMAYASCKLVVPAFYDVVCKNKVARDEDSVRMLELIRDTLCFDFVFMNSSTMDYAAHTLVTCFRNNNANLQSAYAAKQSSAENAFDKLLEPYR